MDCGQTKLGEELKDSSLFIFSSLIIALCEANSLIRRSTLEIKPLAHLGGRSCSDRLAGGKTFLPNKGPLYRCIAIEIYGNLKIFVAAGYKS
jgi:hypothetical protein